VIRASVFCHSFQLAGCWNWPAVHLCKGHGCMLHGWYQKEPLRCADEKTRFEQQVETWNRDHPDEILVIGKNGVASKKARPDPEKQKERAAAAAKKVER
jgi:hypothetical protein